MLVEDCMIPNPLVVTRSEAIDAVADLIRRHGILQVPVVDIGNRLIGIITDRDLRSAGESGKTIHLTAEDIMTREVHSVAPGEDVAEAMKTLCHYRFGSLPVVVGERVVGLISTHDLLRRLIGVL
jgi:CBS domain-containing protein